MNELGNVMHMSTQSMLELKVVYMEGMVSMIRYRHYVVTSAEYIKHDKRMIHNEI